MISPEKLATLETIAESWLGTPFCEGAPKKGIGACCHQLVAEIDFELGLPRFPVPAGVIGWANSQTSSPLAEFLDASPDFQTFVIGERTTFDLQPADHLGFRLRLSVHHLSLVLGGGRMIHSVQRHGVLIAPCIPDTWLRRLDRVWRPKWV